MPCLCVFKPRASMLALALASTACVTSGTIAISLEDGGNEFDSTVGSDSAGGDADEWADASFDVDATSYAEEGLSDASAIDATTFDGSSTDSPNDAPPGNSDQGDAGDNDGALIDAAKDSFANDGGPRDGGTDIAWGDVGSV